MEDNQHDTNSTYSTLRQMVSTNINKEGEHN